MAGVSMDPRTGVTTQAGDESGNYIILFCTDDMYMEAPMWDRFTFNSEAEAKAEIEARTTEFAAAHHAVNVYWHPSACLPSSCVLCATECATAAPVDEDATRAQALAHAALRAHIASCVDEPD